MAFTLIALCCSLVVLQLAQSVPVGDKDLAKNFLVKYQYLSRGRSGASDVSQAIKQFQSYFHLPVTGVADAPTVELMQKPRCGNGDSPFRASFSNNQKRYVLASPWSKTHLTYGFENHGEDLHWKDVEAILADAFKYWSDVSALTFSKVDQVDQADLKIKFGRYSHGDAYPFDGPSGTLAHAFFPSLGLIHFDEDEYYTHGTKNGINLLWVAVHELGHALGLHHTNIYGAVMYPYYQGYKPDMELHYDDINGIQALYPRTQPTEPRPSTKPTSGVTAPPVTTRPTRPEPSTTHDPDCFDRDSRCQGFLEADYCRLYPTNMEYWCTKKCGFC